MKRTPTIAIYWADTGKLLTHSERKALEFNGQMVNITPSEITVIDLVSDRKVFIRGLNDPKSAKLSDLKN